MAEDMIALSSSWEKECSAANSDPEFKACVAQKRTEYQRLKDEKARLERERMMRINDAEVIPQEPVQAKACLSQDVQSACDSKMKQAQKALASTMNVEDIKSCVSSCDGGAPWIQAKVEGCASSTKSKLMATLNLKKAYCSRPLPDSGIPMTDAALAVKGGIQEGKGFFQEIAGTSLKDAAKISALKMGWMDGTCSATSTMNHTCSVELEQGVVAQRIDGVGGQSGLAYIDSGGNQHSTYAAAKAANGDDFSLDEGSGKSEVVTDGSLGSSARPRSRPTPTDPATAEATSSTTVANPVANETNPANQGGAPVAAQQSANPPPQQQRNPYAPSILNNANLSNEVPNGKAVAQFDGETVSSGVGEESSYSGGASSSGGGSGGEAVRAASGLNGNSESSHRPGAAPVSGGVPFAGITSNGGNGTADTKIKTAAESSTTEDTGGLNSGSFQSGFHKAPGQNVFNKNISSKGISKKGRVARSGYTDSHLQFLKKFGKVKYKKSRKGRNGVRDLASIEGQEVQGVWSGYQDILNHMASIYNKVPLDENGKIDNSR